MKLRERIQFREVIPQPEGAQLWDTKFKKFARQTIGNRETFQSPDGKILNLNYFDWTASGRWTHPIENFMRNRIGPLIANTHTEDNHTGKSMTERFHDARETIKTHVNADPEQDVLLTEGSGATGAVNTLQYLLGLRFKDQYDKFTTVAKKRFGADVPEVVWPLPEELKPVVFTSEMEHHSNDISWKGLHANVVYIERGEDGTIDQEHLQEQIDKYKDRKIKIGAFTAASNVTGIKLPVHDLAKIMHKNGGAIFVDYAAGAPYLDIDMHPEDKDAYLDAIYFSPHKFLGGPDTPGILVLNRDLYPGGKPNRDGGGTVLATSPFTLPVHSGDEKEVMTIADIETREDGGTPPFIQTIRAAEAIKLKEEMGTADMQKREEYLLDMVMDNMDEIEGLSVLEAHNRNRLGIVSFHMNDLDLHYNLVVKLLNDKYGIQTRGGCSCAGTYGHRLYQIGEDQSGQIIDTIKSGDLSSKPGWVRVSVHPTNSDEQVKLLNLALKEIAINGKTWEKDYSYDKSSNAWTHKNEPFDAKPRPLRRAAGRVAERVLARF